MRQRLRSWDASEPQVDAPVSTFTSRIPAVYNSVAKTETIYVKQVVRNENYLDNLRNVAVVRHVAVAYNFDFHTVFDI